LKVQFDEPLSISAFYFNLLRYTKEGNLRLLVALIDAKADVNFESKVRRCRLTL
jgi:hypothetical protein